MEEDSEVKKIAEIGDEVVAELNIMNIKGEEAERIAKALAVVDATIIDTLLRNFLLPRIQEEIKKLKDGDQDEETTKIKVDQLVSQFPSAVLQARIKILSTHLSNLETFLMAVRKVIEKIFGVGENG